MALALKADQLDQVQRGRDPDDWKPMNTVGHGVREIRIRDIAGAFRVMYVAKFDDAVYVLHCFPKLLGVTQPRISDLMRGKIKLFELAYGGRSHPALDVLIAKEGQIFSSQNGIERYAILWRLPKRDVAFVRRSSSTFAATWEEDGRRTPPSRPIDKQAGIAVDNAWIAVRRPVASEKRRADRHR
jgi:putative component of toxin-antitoxin plasmid stabilization module